jgi:hypothetical protein
MIIISAKSLINETWGAGARFWRTHAAYRVSGPGKLIFSASRWPNTPIGRTLVPRGEPSRRRQRSLQYRLRAPRKIFISRAPQLWQCSGGGSGSGGFSGGASGFAVPSQAKIPSDRRTRAQPGGGQVGAVARS